MEIRDEGFDDDDRDAFDASPFGPPAAGHSMLAAAFELRDRSRSVAKAVAKVRRMRLPFPPQLEAMADLAETLETGVEMRGGPQLGCLMLDPTGTGKTTAAEAFAEVARENAGPDEAPVVHFRLPTTGTAIGLYANALAKLGDHHANQAREGKLLNHLCERLEESRTKLLVLDEAQQGSAASGIGGQTSAAIKLLLDVGICPVAILGTEKAVGVLSKDLELAGRLSAPTSLAPLVWHDAADRANWVGLLAALDAQLGADGVCASRFGLDDPALAEPLLEACNGTIGQLMGMIRTSVREMARSGRRELTYEDLAYGVDAWNVGYEYIRHNPLRRP